MEQLLRYSNERMSLLQAKLEKRILSAAKYSIAIDHAVVGPS